MSTQVRVEVGYSFSVRTPAKTVFALLEDVPLSASFYPKVERLVDLGSGAYRWEMEKIGVGQFTLQTVYASRYQADAAAGRVSWTPLPDEGNTQVTGYWQVSPQKKFCSLELQLQVQVTLPLPDMMKPVVTPMLQAEFERLTETYIDNLIAHFGGEV